MSKTTQKKNVSYRLLAVLLLAACVSAFFLPFAFLGVSEPKTLISAIKALLESNEKLFGFLPVLTSGGLSEITLANGIIVLTTLCAAVTITFWIFLLRSLALL